MVFDIKIKNFWCEARLIAGSNIADPPATTVYESAVSREMVQIALTIAALNVLNVKVVEILNKYNQALVMKSMECSGSRIQQLCQKDSSYVQKFSNDARKIVLMYRHCMG